MGIGINPNLSLDKALDWLYVIFGVSLLTSAVRIILLLFVFNYDTPKFYILQNKIDKALNVLYGRYREEYVKNKF